MSSSRLNVGKLDAWTASVADAEVRSAGAVEVDVADGSSADEHATATSESATSAIRLFRMPKGDTPTGA